MKYLVEIRNTTVKTFEIEVEADSFELAKEMAYCALNENESIYQTDSQEHWESDAAVEEELLPELPCDCDKTEGECNNKEYCSGHDMGGTYDTNRTE
jgi:hypothetical protein